MCCAKGAFTPIPTILNVHEERESLRLTFTYKPLGVISVKLSIKKREERRKSQELTLCELLFPSLFDILTLVDFLSILLESSTSSSSFLPPLVYT